MLSNWKFWWYKWICRLLLEVLCTEAIDFIQNRQSPFLVIVVELFFIGIFIHLQSSCRFTRTFEPIIAFFFKGTNTKYNHVILSDSMDFRPDCIMLNLKLWYTAQLRQSGTVKCFSRKVADNAVRTFIQTTTVDVMIMRYNQLRESNALLLTLTINEMK